MGKNQNMTRVPTGEVVLLIAIAAAQDENWPGRASGIRQYLSENALDRIREVGQRLIDYATPQRGAGGEQGPTI